MSDAQSKHALLDDVHALIRDIENIGDDVLEDIESIFTTKHSEIDDATSSNVQGDASDTITNTPVPAEAITAGQTDAATAVAAAPVESAPADDAHTDPGTGA